MNLRLLLQSLLLQLFLFCSILFYSVIFCYILLIIINKIFNGILTSKYELDMNKNINMKEVLLQAKLG